MGNVDVTSDGVCQLCHYPVHVAGVVRNGRIVPPDRRTTKLGDWGDQSCGLWRCTHNAEIYARQARKASGLTAKEQEFGWDDFHESLAEERAKLREQLEIMWGCGWTGMMGLAGGFGVGKTFVLKMATALALADGKRAIFQNLSSVLQGLRNTYDQGSDVSYQVYFDKMRAAHVLALDEFDKAKQTEWALEQVHLLLDARYQRASECATLLAWNDAKRMPSYVMSRLSQFTVVDLGKKDIRPLLARKAAERREAEAEVRREQLSLERAYSQDREG